MNIFLSNPLPQREAHEILETIADLSKQLNLPNPEIRPNSPSGPGNGTLLPYRGAAEDGLGANPLIDPAGGVQILLDSVKSEVFRTEVGDLRDFVESLGAFGSENRASHQPSYNSIDVGTYGGALRAWEMLSSLS